MKAENIYIRKLI